MLIRPNRPFNPPTDVIEQVDKLTVIVEIAGMNPGDFNISLQSRRLTISGNRGKPQLEHQAYHQFEIGFGEFRIELNLPWTANRDGVTATYQQGFLQIELPRKPAEQVSIVDLNAEEQEHRPL
jgi:HSP20 family protein